MSKPKTFLVLAAVVMMLASATSGYAYYEAWTNYQYKPPLFLVAQLVYEGNYYNLDSISRQVEFLADTSGSSGKDYFFPLVGDGVSILFVCSSPADTIRIDIDADDVTGTKDTGQGNGTRSCSDGAWSGTGYIYSDRQNFTISGTWGADFVYNTLSFPATYTYSNGDVDITYCSESITEGAEVEHTGFRSTYVP